MGFDQEQRTTDVLRRAQQLLDDDIQVCIRHHLRLFLLMRTLRRTALLIIPFHSSHSHATHKRQATPVADAALGRQPCAMGATSDTASVS